MVADSLSGKLLYTAEKTLHISKEFSVYIW